MRPNPAPGEMLPCNNTGISAMSDAEELARRYLALWADYLSALAADPETGDLLRRWLSFGSQGDGRPTAGAAAAAGAPGERDNAVAQLAARVAELERRLDRLEARRARRRDRPPRGWRARWRRARRRCSTGSKPIAATPTAAPRRTRG